MFLAVNYQVNSALVREESLDGKDYWVVPVALITPGVHQGNNGPLYYSEEHISRSVPSWNTKPIVVYHPKDEKGNFISAANTNTLGKTTVGFLLNTRYDGKLRAEAWLDKNKAASVDPRVADAIKNKVMMEVSTGLFHDLKNVAGSWNGEDYTAEAVNFQPDHLALLPDEIGACSIKDGAGLLQVNSSQVAKARLIVNEISQNQVYQNLSKSLMQKRGEMAYVYEVYDKYFVYSVDGMLFKATYKATDKSLEIDFSSQERVQEQKSFTSLDVTFNRSSHQMITRNEAVSKLIANSAFTEADRDWLSALDDTKFKSISTNTRPLVTNSEVAPVVAVPAAPAAAPVVAPPVTLQSYIDAAPAEIKAQLAEAMSTMNSTRAELVAVITGNAQSPFKVEQLQSMTTETLKGIAAMTPKVTTPATGTGNAAAYVPPANYSGQAPTGNSAAGTKAPVTGLALPSMFPVK